MGIIEIPQMSNKDVLAWAKVIKTLTKINKKQRAYLDLSLCDSKELWQTVFKDSMLEANCEVKYFPLSEGDYTTIDIKMLHPFEDSKLFKPTIGDIIKQIPKRLLNVTIAFEIIYKPINFHDYSVFTKEFAADYHVSIVRLYTTDSKLAEYKYQFCPLNMAIDDYKFCEQRLID